LTVAPHGAGQSVATSIRIDVPSSITQNDHNVRAVVTVTAADGSTPAGQVTMSYSGFQGEAPFAHTLANGSTAYTLDSLPAGTHTLTAIYPAQGKYQASQTTAQLIVQPLGRTVTVPTTITIDVPRSVAQGDPNALAVVTVKAADQSIPTG